MKIKADLDDDAARYFQSCARIRNISVAALIRRLVDKIAQDQMTLAILDDADEPRQRRAGEHRWSDKRAA